MKYCAKPISSNDKLEYSCKFVFYQFTIPTIRYLLILYLSGWLLDFEDIKQSLSQDFIENTRHGWMVINTVSI